MVCCRVLNIFGLEAASDSVPRPQLWKVEYGSSASEKIPFRLFDDTMSKAFVHVNVSMYISYIYKIK